MNVFASIFHTAGDDTESTSVVVATSEEKAIAYQHEACTAYLADDPEGAPTLDEWHEENATEYNYHEVRSLPLNLTGLEIWTVEHESHEHGTAHPSEEAAHRFLLATTKAFRDFEDHPCDERWLETCQDEGWTISQSFFRDNETGE